MARRVIPAAASIAAVAISWCLAATALADVLPPEPGTFWREQQIPSPQSIVIVGVCLSSAAIGVGLLLSRIASARSTTATLVLTGATLVAVVGIAGVAFRCYSQAKRDRQAWQDYRERVKNRRWTPPPQFREGLSPAESPRPAASSNSP